MGILRLEDDVVVGYLFSYIKTLFPRKITRWRRGGSIEAESVLAWDYEFTDAKLKQHGYGDFYAEAAGAEAIAEAVRDWDRGIDAGFGRVFHVEWLSSGPAEDIWFDLGPRNVPKEPI